MGTRTPTRLAGGFVKTKKVERVAEVLGQEIKTLAHEERTHALGGAVVPLQKMPKLYTAIDATGIPVVRHETEDRPGKDATRKTKTRDATLGCVFTQTRPGATGLLMRWGIDHPRRRHRAHQGLRRPVHHAGQRPVGWCALDLKVRRRALPQGDPDRGPLPRP